MGYPKLRNGATLFFHLVPRSGHNAVDSAAEITREDNDHFRDKRSQLLQSGASRDHDDDGDRKIPDVLLIRETLVHRDEDIEPVVRREAQ